jgi:hypothetical protein
MGRLAGLVVGQVTMVQRRQVSVEQVMQPAQRLQVTAGQVMKLVQQQVRGGR